jgi:hypothetical protein
MSSIRRKRGTPSRRQPITTEQANANIASIFEGEEERRRITAEEADALIDAIFEFERPLAEQNARRTHPQSKETR